MEQYFATAQVGDTVYDMAYGSGRITGIVLGKQYPIRISFEGMLSKSYESYEFTGKSGPYVQQTLFYSKPIFDLPPPPKRMVKKVIEGWENIYTGCFNAWTSPIYATEALADGSAKSDRLGPAHFIRHEYWVEE